MTNQPPGRTVATISLERRGMLGVLFEISEAGKEIDGEVHGAGADRQLAHVGTHERERW